VYDIAFYLQALALADDPKRDFTAIPARLPLPQIGSLGPVERNSVVVRFASREAADAYFEAYRDVAVAAMEETLRVYREKENPSAYLHAIDLLQREAQTNGQPEAATVLERIDRQHNEAVVKKLEADMDKTPRPDATAALARLAAEVLVDLDVGQKERLAQLVLTYAEQITQAPEKSSPGALSAMTEGTAIALVLPAGHAKEAALAALWEKGYAQLTTVDAKTANERLRQAVATMPPAKRAASPFGALAAGLDYLLWQKQFADGQADEVRTQYAKTLAQSFLVMSEESLKRVLDSQAASVPSTFSALKLIEDQFDTVEASPNDAQLVAAWRHGVGLVAAKDAALASFYLGRLETALSRRPGQGRSLASAVTEERARLGGEPTVARHTPPKTAFPQETL
jgi:hypothetical protein